MYFLTDNMFFTLSWNISIVPFHGATEVSTLASMTAITQSVTSALPHTCIPHIREETAIIQLAHTREETSMEERKYLTTEVMFHGETLITGNMHQTMGM